MRNSKSKKNVIKSIILNILCFIFLYPLLVKDALIISDTWVTITNITSLGVLLSFIFYVNNSEKYKVLYEDLLFDLKDLRIAKYIITPVIAFCLYVTVQMCFLNVLPSVYIMLFGKAYNSYIVVVSRHDVKYRLGCRRGIIELYEGYGRYEVESASIPDSYFRNNFCINKENKNKIYGPNKIYIEGYESFFGKNIRSYEIKSYYDENNS